MRNFHRLAALAVVAWLVWCPVAFSLPAIAAPSCHGTHEETIDCCQPVVPSPTPTVDVSTVGTAVVPGDGGALAPPFAERIVAAATPLAPPAAGWGRLYLSLSVFLN
jgi:hypothetical protein